MWWDHILLEEFLSRNPKMRLMPMDGDQIVIEGDFDVNAEMEGACRIEETYSLKVVLGKGFPREVPLVFETGGRIPKEPDFHVNPDKSLCLGSYLRIKSLMAESPSLLAFSGRLLIPFLYSVSYKIKFGSFPYGELDHGENGLVDDYKRLFSVNDKKSVLRTLAVLARRKREANKLPCPCGCGLRLGKCEYRFTLDHWRSLERRRWYRSHLANDFTPIPKPKKKRKRKKAYRSADV